MPLEGLISDLDRLNIELKELPPISPDNDQRLQKKIRLEFHYNSNHIEGNTLTYSETELLLLKDDTQGNHTFREYQEMKASDIALESVKALARESGKMTEVFLRDLNKALLVKPYYSEAITQDGKKTQKQIIPGQYKTTPNSVRLQNGEIHSYAAPQETPQKMGELVNWLNESINEKKLNPVEIAAKAHYRLTDIHPFDDGNGRIARLLLNYVLLMFNYPMVIIKSDDKGNYLKSLNEADAGNIHAFVKYIGNCLKQSFFLYIAAHKGEVIESRQDWKKKLTLLKRELETIDELQEKYSPKTVKKALETKIFPLVERIQNLLLEISNLFLENDVRVWSSTHTTPTKLRSDVLNFTRTPSTNYLNDISLTFDYLDFKKNGMNAFSVSVQMDVKFEEFRYHIILANKMLFGKLYHQEINEIELEEIASVMAQVIMEEINNKIN
jgi:Fic family protein